MAGSRTFVVRVLADSKEAVAGLKKLGLETNKLGTDMDKGLGSVLKGLMPSFKTIALVGTAAFGALTAFTIKSVLAAKDAQAEQNRLRQILLTTGGATEQQVKALNDQAKALQNLGVVSAGNISVVQAQLATFDLQAETIKRLTPAVLDYVTAEKGATASSEDFKAMTNGLAQALQGNFGSLTRTGFVLDEATKKTIKSGTETERAAALVEVLNSTYKDFNATLRNTTEGRLQVLRNGFQDVQEEIGKALLPVLDKLLDFFNTKIMPVLLNSVIPGFQMFVDVLGKRGLGEATVFGIAAMGNFGLKVVAVLESVTRSILVFIRDFASIGETVGMIGTLVGALAGDVKLAGLAATSGFALGRLEDDINKRLNNIGKDFDVFRGKINEANKSLAQVIPGTELDRRFGDFRGNMGQNTRATTDLNSALNGTSSTLRKGKDAVREYTDAMGRAGKAQNSFNTSIKATDRAQRSLNQANTSLADAQDRFNRAVAGYGADSQEAKDAQRQLDAAQRGVERAGYRVEDSLFAIADAERELAEVRNRPGASARDVREAEIKLAEAKLSAADAVDSQIDSTRSLSQAQSELNELVNGAIPGSETYELLSRAVAEAELRRADAIEAVTEALRRQAKAERDLFEAIKKTQGFKGRPGFVAKVPDPLGDFRHLIGKIPGMADGGLVNRATLALIGEAGPEVVIPLDRLGGMGDGGTTINIYSTIADETLPEKLVQALRSYNRTTGPVRIQVI